MDPDKDQIRIIWPDPDPDPHRDGENGYGTDPGSIKRSQNKRDKKFVFFLLQFFIRFLLYNNNLLKTRKYKLGKTLQGK